jgi:hypothetical protein
MKASTARWSAYSGSFQQRFERGPPRPTRSISGMGKNHSEKNSFTCNDHRRPGCRARGWPAPARGGGRRGRFKQGFPPPVPFSCGSWNARPQVARSGAERNEA